MNKKGFTLVELLAVIVILVILSALVVPSVFKMVRNAKENSYEVLIDSFENNARLYVSRHRDEIEAHLDTYNYYSLTLEDLKDENLLKLPVTDPRTDEDIDLDKKIFIVRETDKTLSICYEDRECYAPIFLVDKITDSKNVVSGNTEGLHFNSSTNTYYYRGGNPNNWIAFNGELWRIVKINNDNTIKIIYEGKKNKTGTEQDGNIGNNTFDDSNANSYNSAVGIKTRLQNWYNSNITENNRAKVESFAWCIGKTAYSGSGVSTATFLSNECGTKTGSTTIGLLNAGDYLYASLDSNCTTSYKTTGDNGTSCKKDNYLYKNVYNYWTITPDNNSTKVWTVNSTGALGPTIDANNTAHIRPVINLKSNVYIAQGNGKLDNPYIIKDIVSVDNEKPVITLLGDNPMVINLGASFMDPGATAMDNVDGNITNRIIKTTNLNINTAGTYKITYVVSDISGNKTSRDRIINVVSGANKPVLAEGMTPIKWDGSKWVNTTENDSSWFNYDTTEKKWANAKTADGSMWVWIPRYVYRITNGWHSNSTGTIEVKFSKGINDTIGGTVSLVNNGKATDSDGTWTSHPGFTFGNTELTGIWVAKYEATSVEEVTNSTAGDNVTTKTVKIVPNVQSWRYITTGNAFTAIRKMESNGDYGWITASGLKEDGTYTNDNNNIDAHLMKNSEWGAVAYLSKSQYGKNTEEIAINTSSDFITGTGGMSASTTGNIYGIYDISGGAMEMVSAYVDNGDGNLTNYGLSIINAVNKYKDIYTIGSTDTNHNNYNLTINKKGDAVYETSNNTDASYAWFNDYAYMPNAKDPWFYRGGDWNGGVFVGAFYFVRTGGNPSSNNGFRPVLVVHAGL